MAKTNALMVTIIVCGLRLGMPSVAHAANITVTTTADTNHSCFNDVCTTLRAAIGKANTNFEADTITLGAGTYTIADPGGSDDGFNAKGDFDIYNDVTIVGASSSTTIIDAGAKSRIFDINPLSTKPDIVVTLRNLTLRNGLSAARDRGGAIRNRAHVFIDGCTLTSNVESALYNLGTATITNSKLDSNQGLDTSFGIAGAAIYNQGTLSVSGGTIDENANLQDQITGGAVYFDAGTATFSRVTVSGNAGSSRGDGGAFYLGSTAANVTVSDCYFSGHGSDGSSLGIESGAAIYQAAGTLAITRTRFSNNRARGDGAAIFASDGTLTIFDSSFSTNIGNGWRENFDIPPTSNSLGATIALTGTVTASIDRSSFSSNKSLYQNSDRFEARGGAITLRDLTTPVSISNSRFNDNSTEDYGGAIAVRDGTGPIRIWSSSFTRNSSKTGGAIYIWRSSLVPIELASVTIVNNTAGVNEVGFGGGIHAQSGTITLHNSIVAGNTTLGNLEEFDDIVAAGTSLGYNAIGTGPSELTTVASDVVGGYLGLVESGSGSNTVLLPAVDSFVIDGADPTGCTDPTGVPLLYDLEWQPRTSDGNGDAVARCDVGAVELVYTARVDFGKNYEAISEAAGNLVLTLKRSGTSTSMLDVNYATADESAIGGTDYTTSTGTVHWNNGDLADKTITIPILQNTNIDVGMRRFTVSLSAAIATVDSPVNIDILDDEVNGPGRIEITTTQLAVTEGSGGGATQYQLTFRRTGGTSGTVGATVQLVSGTAAPGRDYDDVGGALSWTNGDAADIVKTFTVWADNEDEADEQLTIQLVDPTGGATLGVSSATITILDDDATIAVPGTLALSSATYSVDEAAGTLTVGAVRSGGGDGAVTIDYQTNVGTAVAADFASATGTLRWENGEQGEKLVVLTIKDDALDESNETFSFQLKGGTITGGATLGSPSTATITILDDDLAAPAGRISLSADTYTVNEAGTMVTITARRTQGSNGAIDVQYFTTDGTATAAGLDYTPTSGPLHWDNGDTTNKTFVVAINNDTIYEGDETFDVVLSDDASTTPVTFGTASATVTIRDNDTAPITPGVLSFAVDTADVNEGGKVTMLVSRTGGSDGKVTVQCASADGTAVAPGDYTAVSRSLVWLAGDAEDKKCAVDVADDAAVDPSETFSLSLSNPSGGATLGAIANATVTVIDNDSAGTLVFSQAAYSANERDADATITVQRRGGAAGVASVTYAATAGSATTADFTPVTNTLRWEAGDATAKTFTVAVKHDALFENDETVNLALSAASGATLGAQATAVLTIHDDDPAAGTIEVVSTTYGVAETAGTVTIQVRRSGSTTGSVSISYATDDDAATAGSDYTAKTGTLTWGNGVGGAQDIVVNVTNDAVVESDEAFVLTLANPTGGASLGRSKATITILDNDGAASTGSITLGAATYARKENLGVVTLTATRASGTGAATVGWQTAAGTATADVDFVQSSGTVSWGDGETGAKNITVTLLDDSTYEGDETFTVTLSNATNGITLGAPSSATVTITDDETAPATNGTLSFNATAYNVVEGSGTLSIPVARANGSTGAISVKCTAVAGSATAPSDFSATNATINWANGDSATKNCNIPIANDGIAEPGEIFTVTLSAATGGAVVGVGLATVTISDDDGAGRLSFEDADYTVGEERGTITITITRTGGSIGAVDVDYATAHDTAKGADYVPASGTLHWADGDAAPKTFDVTISDDFVFEGDESFKLRLSRPTGGAKLGAANRAVTIIDDDPPAGWISITKANSSATELDPSVTLQVNRKGTLTGAVTVAFATTAQTATAGSDYTTTSGTLSWASGEGGNKNIVVPLLDDSTVEGDETFLVKLSNATGGAAIERAANRVTITDVEAAGLVSLDATSYSAGESSTSLTITATRTASFGGAVSVAYATANDTATQPSDYTTTAGTLSWANGESGSKTFTIPITADSTPEGDETFTITLSSPTGGVGIGNSPATVTIVDDDPFPDLAQPDDLSTAPSPDLVGTLLDLATAPVDLGTAPADLAAESADLAAENTDLATESTDLSGVTIDQAEASLDLVTTAADLTTVDGPVDLASNDDTARADLAAENTDLATSTPAPKDGCGCNTTPNDTVPSLLGAALLLVLLQRGKRRRA